MRDFFKRIDWLLVMIYILVIALVILAVASIADAADNQYLRFPNFSAGLTTNQVGEIPPNACLRLENFLFDNQELRVRKGYQHISEEFNTSGVNYIGFYKKQGTAGKLIVKSGTKLFIVNRANIDTTWADDEYTQLFIISGTVNKGDSASFYLYSANQNTKFENYAFNSIQLDSSTQTSYAVGVDYAVNDTTLKLTDSLPEQMTGWTYSVPVAIGDIVSGETFVDSFYMATSTGKLRYNDSTLLGTQTQAAYRDVIDSILSPGNQYVRYFFNSSMLDGTQKEALSRASSGTAFLKITLRQVGHSAMSMLSGEIYYVTLPIDEAVWATYPTSFSILTQGGAFTYDTTGALPIASILEMEIDPTTAFTVRMDSVIVRDGLSRRFVTFVDDSLMAGKDSTFFASGDWFYTFGNSASDDYWAKRNAVIGNYLDDSLRFHGTAPYGYNGNDWFNEDSIGTNVSVTFYRRRVISGSSGGYVAAVFWNDRWCTVADSTPSQIDFSEDFEPMVSSGLLVQVNPDDGEPILWLKQMYGTLIIGKHSSIWKLTGVPGIDDFARLDKSVDGISFVAPNSILQRGGLMFGLGRDAFYVYDFNSMIRISEQINDLVKDSINWSRVDQINCGYFDNHLWWSYPSKNSIVNDRTVCYDPQNKSWSTSTLNFHGIYVDNSTDDTSNTYIGDPETGKVYLYGVGTTDDGVGISASLYSTWFDMGSTFLDKVVNRFAVVHHRESTSSVLVSCVAKREDGLQVSSSRTFTGGLDNYRGNKRLWFDTNGLRGMEYQIQLTATSAIGLRIGNVEVEYQILSAGY